MAEEFDDHSSILVDRCWTLPPLSALSALLSSLIVKNGALFYVAFMDEFGVSHQSATWPLTVHGVTAHLAGLFVSLLQKKLPTYHIAVAGSLLNFLSVLSSAFAPNITWMTATLGLIGGAGYGMIVITLSIYTVVYFDKYRGTASGFKYTGMTLAPLAFPLALSVLIREYSVFGALLLLSAVELNTLPVAMLMNKPRPVSLSRLKGCASLQREKYHKSYGTKVDCNSLTSEEQSGPVFTSRTSALNTSETNTCNGLAAHDARRLFSEEQATVTRATIELHTDLCASKDNIEDRGNQPAHEAPPQGVIVSDDAEDTPKRINLFGIDFCESKAKMRRFKAFATAPCKRGENHNEECDIHDDVSLNNKAQSEVVRLFRNPLLYLLVATFSISEYTISTFEITVLDYTMDKGFSRSEAEPVITYIAAAELIGRLTLPFLWDCAELRRTALVALCLTVTAASLALMPHSTEFSHVVVAVVITGCSCGCAESLKPVLLSDHLGVQMLSLCWGITGIAMVPFAFGGPFLIGLFRDNMGSYDNLYRMMAALCFAFAAMLFTLTFFERRTRKRIKEATDLNQAE